MLEDFLRGLRAGGQADSPGAFTISRVEALRKLGTRPFAALPWLVNAALDGGATWLRIYRGPQEVVLEYDGAPPNQLSPDRSDDLTLGLLLAARRGVQFQGGCLALTAGPEHWDVRSCSPCPHQQLRLACPPNHEGLYYWLDRLRLAPVPVEVEGAGWSVADLGAPHMLSRTVGTTRLQLGRRLFASVRPGLPTLVLVVGGISVAKAPEWTDAHVVARPQGLQRTLEGDGIVENEAYHALLAELYAILQDMALELRERTRDLPVAITRQLGWVIHRYLTSES